MITLTLGALTALVGAGDDNWMIVVIGCTLIIAGALEDLCEVMHEKGEEKND